MIAKSLYYTLTITLTLAMVACSSSSYRKPESIEEKMNRFLPRKSEIGKIPKFEVMHIDEGKYAIRKNKRTPASVDTNAGSETTIGPFRNKRTYFLTLLSQYEDLSSYSENSAPKITTCPNFHTSLIKHRETQAIPFGVKRKLNVNFTADSSTWKTEYLARYPELSLPVVSDDIIPTVADIIKRDGQSHAHEILQNALNIHIIKTHSELRYLCENGVSNNYYTFENLVTHIHRQPEFVPNSDNMKYLLKTTIFSNMALIKSIRRKSTSRSRGIASTTSSESYGNDLIKGLKINWVKKYFGEMKIK